MSDTKEITVRIEDGVVIGVTGIPAGYTLRVEHTETDGNGFLEGPMKTKPDGTQYTEEFYTADGSDLPAGFEIDDDGIVRPELKTVDVTAKEWFDKSAGNSYFAAVVTVNHDYPHLRRTLYIPMQGGYGNAYEFAARDLLIREGYLTDQPNGSFKTKPDGPLSLILRNREIAYRPMMIEKQLKRDVEAWGME